MGDFGDKEYPCREDTECPANFYKIVQGFNMQALADDYAESLVTNDYAKLANIMGKLAGMHPAISSRIEALARGKIRSSKSPTGVG